MNIPFTLADSKLDGEFLKSERIRVISFRKANGADSEYVLR
jgi:uncharacterized DUF497 family protein